MSVPLRSITTRLGYEQITNLTTAVGLTVPQRDVNGLSARPTVALITPATAGVRWRDDGVDPTAAVGMPLAAGVTLQYDGDLTFIRFIQSGGTAELNISYYA